MSLIAQRPSSSGALLNPFRSDRGRPLARYRVTITSPDRNAMLDLVRVHGVAVIDHGLRPPGPEGYRADAIVQNAEIAALKAHGYAVQRVVRTKSGDGRLNQDLGAVRGQGGDASEREPEGAAGPNYAAREYSVVRPNSFRSRTIAPAAAAGFGSGATRSSAMWGRPWL